MKFGQVIFLLFLVTAFSGCKSARTDESGFLLESEFIYSAEDVPFPSCHASTIVETSEGLICAWFGGTHEKNKDVGIWLSRQDKGEWSKPVEVVNGIQNDTLRYPTWNPVLHYSDNQLILFYKVGPNPRDWWGEMMTSDDLGNTWSSSVRFPDNIWGPIRNKPLLLADGTLLCPSSTENNGWRVHMEWTADKGKTWQRTEALNNGDSLAAIQPTILVHPRKKIQILCRTKSNRIYSAWSDDQGQTWTQLESIGLPNNNSGIDAVTLADGRHLLVYNHIDRSKDQGNRNLLHVAVSEDGLNWNAASILENDENIKSEYSYPAVIQTRDGKVHITYTWKRELVKHVIVNTERIQSVPIQDGIWPASVK